MKKILLRYDADEAIPVKTHLTNRKLRKYFNRETAAAVMAMGELLQQVEMEPAQTPIYYATGLLEYEDYGLDLIVEDSVDGDGRFSSRRFIEDGLSRISPLNQFKVLQNVPLCFVSIEFGFTHDNAVVYSAAAALLQCALAAPRKQVVIGAGKTHADGAVEAGFALVNRDELRSSQYLEFAGEAIEVFR